MRRALLAGILAVLLPGATTWARDLPLTARVEVAAGFVRLSDFVAGGEEKERLKSVFLGELKAGESRRITLEYVRTRLLREGYLTLEPRTETGRDFLEAVGREATAATPAPALLPEAAPAGEKTAATPGERKRFEYVAPLEYIRRGTVITRELLAMKTVDRALPDGATSFEEVVGKRAERGLAKDTAINRGHVVQPPLVARNDWVRIVIDKPGLKITGLGKAQEDGYMGDIIEVRRGSQALRARVAGPKSVEIVEET